MRSQKRTSLLSALVCAGALALGGPVVATAQPPTVGETSVDSGIVGGGSNHGLRPEAQTLNAPGHHHGYGTSNNRVSDHGKQPKGHTSGDRYSNAGNDLNQGNTSVDSALTGNGLDRG